MASATRSISVRSQATADTEAQLIADERIEEGDSMPLRREHLESSHQSLHSFVLSAFEILAAILLVLAVVFIYLLIKGSVTGFMPFLLGFLIVGLFVLVVTAFIKAWD